MNVSVSLQELEYFSGVWGNVGRYLNSFGVLRKDFPLAYTFPCTMQHDFPTKILFQASTLRTYERSCGAWHGMLTNPYTQGTACGRGACHANQPVYPWARRALVR